MQSEIAASANFTVGAGNLAYRNSGAVISAEMTWFDRQGVRLGTIGGAADYSNPALSPDGRLLAVSKRDPSTRFRAIWVYDLIRGVSSKLTIDAWDNTNPAWSADSRRIAFTSKRSGDRDVYMRAADGSGQEELLLQSDLPKSVEDWTRDGKYLIFNQGPQHGLWALPMTGERKPLMLLNDFTQRLEAQVSPDGKWLAYYPNPGASEIFVQNFPPAGGKWQVSTAGGSDPQWNPNGKELFFMKGNNLPVNKIMAVTISDKGGAFDHDAPKTLFEVHPVTGVRNSYVVSPDGRKFLIINLLETLQPPITVVLNWKAPGLNP